ncbi:MAG: metallophosphoesterase [Thalassobius sp.]|nr:metallophosphoesterase [Thalassovita sp.]
MRFVVISDTHGYHRELTLPKGDVLIHGGDFCHLGDTAQMHDFLNWFESLNYQTKIFIGGNHDFFAADKPKDFQSLIPSGITYLNDSGFKLNGLNIWGSPVQPDLIGWAFGVQRGNAMNKHWRLIPKNTDILITHTPPKGILDKSASGMVLGCEELKKKLTYVKPKIHIFGHVHASYGVLENTITKYINASNMDSDKGLVNPPVVFEI